MAKPTKRKTPAAASFPTLYGKSHCPTDHICPQCLKAKISGDRGMAVFSGGAMRVTSYRTRSAEIADDCIGFLSMVWHADNDGVFSFMRIADWTPGGQFEFYFCSTECLRSFFNACVDQMETNIRRQRKSRSRKKA